MYTGSCLCGEVRFRIDDEPGPIELCHCRQCRKAQGSAFAANAPVAASAFRVTSGAEFLKAFESSPGHDRIFCSRCGSPIVSRTKSGPDVVRVRVGTIDGALKSKPVAHYCVGSKANWWEITDDLPQHLTE